MLGYWVAFAFLSPRSTMPYVPGGACSFFTSDSRSASVLGGVNPFEPKRILRLEEDVGVHERRQRGECFRRAG